MNIMIFYNINKQIIFICLVWRNFMVFSDVLFQLYSVLIILFWPVVLIFVVYAVLKFMKLTKEQNKYLSEISEELKKQNE